MTTSAGEYHRKTSYDRDTLGGHYLDRGNQPSVYKDYPALERLILPRADPWPEVGLSGLRTVDRASGPTTLHDRDLAGILALTHCVTATTRHEGTEFHFRNVASAGALYPFELYVATRGISGIDDGLFHHGIMPQGLTQLRRGDVMASVRPALGGKLSDDMILFFFLTAIFFRSAWKYRARAYRYHLLDTGHLLESLLLALRSVGLGARIYYDFDDNKVNELLGVDPAREACLAIAAASMNGTPRAPQSLPGPLAKDTSAASRVAPREAEYPEIRAMHTASSITRAADLPEVPLIDELGYTPGARDPIPEPARWPEVMSYPEAVAKRRSSRNFVQQPLGEDHMRAFLNMICSSEDPCEPWEADLASVVTGFSAIKVDRFDPGFYLIDKQQRLTSRVRTDAPATLTAHICLGQEWLANCAAHFMFVTNLDVPGSRWGPRGYRYSMLTAGRLGQRIYLTATSMGIGCCGIGAFFDREAAALLGLNDASAVVYLVGVGPIRKWSPR